MGKVAACFGDDRLDEGVLMEDTENRRRLRFLYLSQ